MFSTRNPQKKIFYKLYYLEYYELIYFPVCSNCLLNLPFQNDQIYYYDNHDNYNCQDGIWKLVGIFENLVLPEVVKNNSEWEEVEE